MAILVVLVGCNGDDSVTSPHLSRFNQRANGEVSIGQTGAIVLSNPYGAIIVDAQNLDSTSTWFLDKWLQASSGESASAQMSWVRVQSEAVGDTHYVSVTAPTGTTGLEVLLSVTVPFNIPCIVASVGGQTTVSGLHAEFVGRALGSVNLSSHSASCDISGIGGPMAIQMELPDSGFCTVRGTNGDISLQIPVSTSATLSASTSQGTIAFSGLQISGQTANPGILTGTLGTGRGRIVLATQSGNISLRGF
jgi:hypothetical protein